MMRKITFSKQLYVPATFSGLSIKKSVKIPQSVGPLPNLRASQLKFSTPLQSYLKRGENKVWSNNVFSFLPLYSRNTLSFNANQNLSKQAVRYFTTPSKSTSNDSQQPSKSADDLIKYVK